MKRGLVFLVLLSLGGLSLACTDSPFWPRFPASGPLPSLLEEPPTACYAGTAISLLTDGSQAVGSVRVGNDEESLYVVYETSGDGTLRKTALFVGDDPSQIPTTAHGIPEVAQFIYGARHSSGTTQVVWEIPLERLSGETAVVAAFARIRTGSGLEKAWAQGIPIGGSSHPGSYFSYELLECAVKEVDDAGGQVATPDGGAALDIPEGALTTPVEITIQPIDVGQIGDSGAQPVAGAATAGSSSPTTGTDPSLAQADGGLINGVLPIQGTAYRFGPSGLEFSQPVTVTLTYDPESLPPTVDEDLLRVFIANGVFEGLPTVVDKTNHVLTATTTHFSDFFIGTPTASDLSITSVTAMPDPARYDQELTLSVQGAVASDGAPVSSATVTVSLSGVAFLANEIPAECTLEPGDGDPFVYTCDTGFLESGSTAGPFHFTLEPFAVFGSDPGTLNITAEIEPETASGVTDTDGNNDSRALDLLVLPAMAADLRVTDVGASPAVIKAGTEMTLSATVESRSDSPDPVEATLQFEIQAGSTLLDIPGDRLPADCTVAQGLTMSTVGCQVGTLAPGESVTREIVAIPFRAGTRTFSATADQSAGDINPGDNSVSSSYTAETSEVDLSVTIDESFDPIQVTQTVVYSATVESLPASVDPLPRGVLRIEALGDVQVSSVSDACQDVSDAVGFAAVNCPLPTLAPGEEAPDFLAMGVEALSPDQDIEAQARLLLADYVVDPNESNNSAAETTRVVGTVEADLEMTRFNVDPDPAKADLDMTYFVEIENPISSFSDVAGATLEIFIQGSVEVQSLPTFCTSATFTFPSQTTVTCDLPEILRGSAQSAFATVRPSDGLIGQNLDATATVSMPDGGVDTDPADNSRNLLTPVVSPEVNLFLAPIQESADPVSAGETVTYTVRGGNSAGSESPDATPEGSVIELRLTGGDATLVSASPACEDFSSVGPEPVIVVCRFGPTGPGALTPEFDIEVAPAGAPQTLEVTVEVKPRSGTTEVDPSDNTGTETTRVQSESVPDL